MDLNGVGQTSLPLDRAICDCRLPIGMEVNRQSGIGNRQWQAAVAGIEPADPSFKAADVYQQKLPRGGSQDSELACPFHS